MLSHNLWLAWVPWIKGATHPLYQVHVEHSQYGLPYSGKVWRALNLANWLVLTKFKFGDLDS